LAFPVIKNPVRSNESDAAAAKRSNSRLAALFLTNSIRISPS
jgi:hypothetical protein